MDKAYFIQQYEKLLCDLKGIKAFTITNLDTKETFSLNGNMTSKRSASTIKIYIMIAALIKAQRGEISLYDKIELRESDKVEGSGVLKAISAGIALPLIDIITLMIIVSDNTATNLAIEYIGYSYINAVLKELGANNSFINRKFFDMNASRKGFENQSSSDDLVVVLAGLHNKALLDAVHTNIALDILFKQQCRTKIPAKLINIYDENPKIKVANKTGEVDYAQHDCGIVYTPNATIAMAFMTWETDDRLAQEWIADMARLAVEYFDKEAL